MRRGFSECVLAGAGPLIADEPIRPGGHRLDGDLVGAGLARRDRVHEAGRIPGLSRVLAIHADHGKVLDIAQADPHKRTFRV